jgi:signal peptidase I
VEIKDGKVYVNGVADATSNLSGKVVTEPRKNPKYSNLTVQKGYIYALGDNRPNSMDSRILGPIEKKYITGRAVFRFYPFNKFGKP